jgi:aquaporin Z
LTTPRIGHSTAPSAHPSRPPQGGFHEGDHTLFAPIFAETFGTFWLVFGGCGSAVLSAAYPALGIGFAGVALAFGLTVLTMAFAVGHVSGGHFNPAVTVGLWAGGRFPASRIAPYVAAQVLGAVLATLMLAVIAGGHEGWTGNLASNGFGEHSPAIIRWPRVWWPKSC